MFCQRLRDRGVVAVGRLDRVRVCLPRAMTGLASVNVVFVGKGGVPVPGLLVAHCFIFVAFPAELGSRKITRGCVKIRHRARNRRLCFLLREGRAERPDKTAGKQDEAETQ